jgi:hypothetical protein
VFFYLMSRFLNTNTAKGAKANFGWRGRKANFGWRGRTLATSGKSLATSGNVPGKTLATFWQGAGNLWQPLAGLLALG